MFSGIQSFLFGKKQHKHEQDDSMEDKSQVSTDNDFVILERRHSDDYDRNTALYPNLNPSQPYSNLPYAISPSLPNLKDAVFKSEGNKEEAKIDMLQGVPFVLSPHLVLLNDSYVSDFKVIWNILVEMKNSEIDFIQGLLETFNYDFELEHTVLSEFSDS